MRKNRFKYHQAKLKRRKVKPFSFRLLFLSMLLGVAGGITALLIALMLRGVEINWGSLLSSVGVAVVSGGAINQQNKSSRKGDSDSPDLDPLPTPINPKPFTPTPFVSVREVKEDNYVGMARELVAKNSPKTIAKTVYPIFIPYQVRAMVNGDERLALRLYEGIASRYRGKDEQWVWGKVESDLERDRR